MPETPEKTPGEIKNLLDDLAENRGPSYEEDIRADERHKVAEQIAAEIERVIGAYPDNAEIRPKYERGGFLNDIQWAARIARQIGEASADT